MRVSFTDEATGQPYQISGFPYFRGGVLDDYRAGRWVRDGAALDPDNMDPLTQPQRIYSAVRQQVHMESSRGSEVFAVAPPCGMNETSKSMRIRKGTQEVRYFPEANDDPMEYTIGTLGFRNGLQSEFTPMFVSTEATKDFRPPTASSQRPAGDR